ncbi:MAG TPA: hypothetical protein VMI52_07080 [Acetobacteraceae bacterium]|nr:hypothetical protein [Acetobacteraceae bacterium]
MSGYIHYRWVNTKGGAWTDAGNWSPAGGPPHPISLSPGAPPIIDGDATFATGFKGSYTVTGTAVSPTITVDGDQVVFSNFQTSYLFQQAASLRVIHGGSATFSTSATFDATGHESELGLSADGGTVIVHGTFIGAVEVGAGGRLDISGNGATVRSMFADLSVKAGGRIDIEQGGSLSAAGTVASGSFIVIQSGGHWTIAGIGGPVPRVLAGSIALLGGSIDTSHAGGAVVNTGAIWGHGEISGGLENRYSIDAQGGTLSLSGSLTGNGFLAISPGATLALDASTDEIVVFAPFDARLHLAHGVAETGLLRGFGVGDQIDLAGTQVTRLGLQASGGNTVLTAYDQQSVVGHFTLAGHYAPGQIALSPDGHGGTVLTDVGALGTKLAALPAGSAAWHAAYVAEQSYISHLPHLS